MHDPRPGHLGHLGGVANQAVGERSVRVACPGMYHEPRRLIDHDQICIFKNDLSKKRLGKPGFSWLSH